MESRRVALPYRAAFVLISLLGCLLVVGSVVSGAPTLVARPDGPIAASGHETAPDAVSLGVGGGVPLEAQPASRSAPITETTRPRQTVVVGASPTSRPAPPVATPGTSQVFDRGKSGRPEVALTFDAGSDRGYAEEILDILGRERVKASFGITGHWAEANPDLVQRMVAEGHMIFNHTWTHRSKTGFSTGEEPMSSDERFAELLDTETEIRSLTGYETAPYFRPPYGDLDEGVLEDVAGAGYSVTVMWSCDSFGWNEATAGEIVERCAVNASPGDIILMHVGAASQDAAALSEMIETLRGQNLSLVTIEQILER